MVASTSPSDAIVAPPDPSKLILALSTVTPPRSAEPLPRMVRSSLPTLPAARKLPDPGKVTSSRSPETLCVSICPEPSTVTFAPGAKAGALILPDPPIVTSRGAGMVTCTTANLLSPENILPSRRIPSVRPFNVKRSRSIAAGSPSTVIANLSPWVICTSSGPNITNSFGAAPLRSSSANFLPCSPSIETFEPSQPATPAAKATARIGASPLRN